MNRWHIKAYKVSQLQNKDKENVKNANYSNDPETCLYLQTYSICQTINT